MQIPPRCNFASASFSAIPGKLEVGPKLRPACSGACLSAWFRIGRAPTAGSRGYLGAKRPHWATRLAETSAKAKNSAGRANAWLGNQARGPPSTFLLMSHPNRGFLAPKWVTHHFWEIHICGAAPLSINAILPICEGLVAARMTLCAVVNTSHPHIPETHQESRMKAFVG